ncbi:MAG TPA: hypothetical protein VNT75_09400, partial [Symbiobacteriaceae bacterium]|nr:hypothetical protein [Symbiobacteriaceae bacterium]
LAAPVLFMVVPFLYLLGSQLGAQMAPVAAVLAAFATGLMTPVLDESDARLQWALPALALLVGLGCLFTGTTGGTDAAHPRTYDLSYSLNGDSGQAHWLTFEGPNAVTAALFPSQQSEYVPARQHVPVYTERSRIRQAAAPAQPLAAPEASVLEDRVQDGVRHLTLQVRSPRGASELLFLSTDLALLEASVGGQVAIKGQQLQLRYVQPPAGGIRLDLKLKAGAPFKLQVTDHTYGLPAAIAPQVPSGWMPRNSYYVDSTFVTRTWTY